MEKNEKAIAIGKKLTELRGVRTRTGVSKELGVSYSAMCNYERGRRTVPDDLKVRIAEYYHTSVAEIFFPDNYSEK